MQIPDSWRLDGRVCLITGATAGIGRAGALAIARLGADVALVGRSRSRLARVERDVREIAPQARIITLCADLSSLAEVRGLAVEAKAQLPRLDILINNAGVCTRTREETADGFEMQFGVNHLAPFLLTNLLLDRLAQSAPSRVVTVASQVERSGRIDFDDLQGRHAYDPIRAYRQSKLANILFTRELAKRTRRAGITAISIHPGVYTTRLLDDYNGWSRIVTLLRDRGLPGPDQAGSVLARAAAWSELEGAEAPHLHEHRLADPSEQARDAELAARLWTESVRLTGLAA